MLLAIALVGASSAMVRAGEKSEIILGGPVDRNSGSSGQRAVAGAFEDLNAACTAGISVSSAMCSATFVMDGGDVDRDSFLDVRSDIVAQQLS
ncbi:MAG: hypothetical protein ACREXU_21120, partial [Gammaproteobacteria bacterium]